MTKQEFLAQLRKGLSSLPREDLEERLTFYSEIIEDRIEEGLSESDAVLSIVTVDEVVTQAVAETSFAKISKERIIPKRRLRGWEILLLTLGSPLWLSLGIATVAIFLSIYVSLWSAIISLWAVFGTLVICFVGCIVAGVMFACNSDGPTGVVMIAVGIVCAGLSVFMFYGCKTATKGILILTKKLAVWIKRCFIKKEAA